MRTALMAFFGGIPNRTGYDTGGRGKLLTIQLHQAFQNRYRAENHFDLLRAIGFSPKLPFERECFLQWNKLQKPLLNNDCTAQNS